MNQQRNCIRLDNDVRFQMNFAEAIYEYFGYQLLHDIKNNS